MPGMQLPKDRLFRSARLELRAENGGMPTLFGYMLRFNEWVEIDSLFEGKFMEKISPGAAKSSLSENKDSIRILLNHGKDPMVGMKPLTAPTLTEDKEGVLYEGELFDTRYNRELIPALEAGQYGSSIKFRVTDEEFKEEPKQSDSNPKGLPERNIKGLELYEGGPVTFPAYAGATAGIRSLTDEYIAEFGGVPEDGIERIVVRFAEREPERMAELVENFRSSTEAEVERAVIAYQKTGTSTASWDAGANEKRLPSPMPVATMRKAYAWMDTSMMSEGMCPKSAGKFIHHEVSSSGTPGDANLAACSAGIGVLNGGRGGANIPSGDRQGVYDHLARHLRDAGREPPPLRSADDKDASDRTLPGAEKIHSSASRPIEEAIGSKRVKRALEKSI